MRADEAAIVTHRLFAAFPGSKTVLRDAKAKLSGTRDEYELFFREYPRETGDAIVTKAVVRYEWLPTIKHLAMIAREVAGDGAFARMKERLLEAGRWAVGQGFRQRDGMTLREFFTGELGISNEDLDRYRARDPKTGKVLGEFEWPPPPELVDRVQALEALLSELDEYGGHRTHGDPIQAALGMGSGE